MAEAMQEVRRELGSESVILHTRSLKRGGVLGIGAKAYVEVTAADGRDVGRRSRAGGSNSAQALPRRAAANLAPVEPTAGDLIRRTYAAAKAEMNGQPAVTGNQIAPPSQAPTSDKNQAQVEALLKAAGLPAVMPGRLSAQARQAAAAPPVTHAQPDVVHLPPPQPAVDTNAQLNAELREVKNMVARVMRSQAGPAPDLPEPLVKHYLQLIEQEVSAEMAESIVAEARSMIDRREADDADACHKAVAKVITRYLPVDPEAGKWVGRKDGRPRTIALVGPTGVGKTTTLAKLAATFKLKHGKDIAMITLDTYRIAAVEQLRTYAGIIGVPLKVAQTASELRAAVASFSEKDAILIDTAGRSQRDLDKLDELQEMMDSVAPHEVHLVLSSTCTQRVILETIERFSKVRTDRIIFTKLDEAVTGGVLLNVAKLVNKRLSYITTGQEVPHQIEATDAGRLAELVMGQRISVAGEGSDG